MYAEILTNAKLTRMFIETGLIFHKDNPENFTRA